MNLIKRNAASIAPMPTRPRSEWDPFRRLTDLMRWDAFGDSTSLFPGFDGGEFLPNFEVKETKDDFRFSGDVPGVREKDLEVTISGNMLTISGKRVEEKRTDDDKYHSYERRYGSFSRAFVLPDVADVEHARAELKDGVLSIALPKKPNAQAKHIKVSTTKALKD